MIGRKAHVHFTIRFPGPDICVFPGVFASQEFAL